MREFIGDSLSVLLAPFRMILSFLLIIAAAIDFFATCVGWISIALVCAGICFCSMWISFSLVRMMFSF